MGQRVGKALGFCLCLCTHSACLTARRDADRYARQRAGRHAKDVGIEIVCVQDIDFLGSQVAHKSPQLHYRVAIVKTVQRIRRDVIEVQVFDLGAEHALGIEAGKLNSEPIAFAQEASELDGLTLRSALMETVNQLKNNWFQYSNGPHLEPAKRGHDYFTISITRTVA